MLRQTAGVTSYPGTVVADSHPAVRHGDREPETRARVIVGVGDVPLFVDSAWRCLLFGVGPCLLDRVRAGRGCSGCYRDPGCFATVRYTQGSGAC